jgi:anti-sigma factor RsiW
MTHATDDALLLHAYGELPDEERRALDVHLAACATCRARFGDLEESRVALAWGSDRRPAVASRGRRLAWIAVPVAAGIAALVLMRRAPEPSGQPPAWHSHLSASPTAGYVTGGATFIAIDSQLTLLEQRTLP